MPGITAGRQFKGVAQYPIGSAPRENTLLCHEFKLGIRILDAADRRVFTLHVFADHEHIDIARFLVGEMASLSGIVKTCNTSRKTDDGDAEPVTADEENMALVEFENGTIGTIESSCISTGRKNQLA